MKKVHMFLLALILVMIVFLTSCAKLGNYKILGIDVVGNVGKISYITLRYLNPLNQSVSDVPVKVELFDETQNEWKEVSDALTGQKIFQTDEMGNITFSILPKTAGIYKFRLLNIADITSMPVEFSVNVGGVTWGFLIWLAADNDLEPYSYLDLEEMRTQNPDVFIMVMHDKYSNSNGNDSLMLLDENGEFKEIKTFGMDINSGSLEFLKEILEDFYAFNMEKSGLIIWNHGNSWVDDSNFNLAVGYDFTKQDALTTKEIGGALEYVNSEYGRTLDFIGFDACNMGTIEIAYELRNCAKYFVASAFTEPAFGWDYTFLSALNHDSGIYDLARDIIDSYFEFYEWLGYTGELSLGAYDLSKIQDIAYEISKLSNELTESMSMDENLRSSIINEYYPQLLQYYSCQDCMQMIDILDFLNVLCKNVDDLNLLDIRNNLLNVVFEDFIVYKRMYTSYFWNTGLGLFLPNNLDTYQQRLDDMLELEFYKDTSWKNFLEFLLIQ